MKMAKILVWALLGTGLVLSGAYAGETAENQAHRVPTLQQVRASHECVARQAGAENRQDVVRCFEAQGLEPPEQGTPQGNIPNVGRPLKDAREPSRGK